jgi:hypothetical protein
MALPLGGGETLPGEPEGSADSDSRFLRAIHHHEPLSPLGAARNLG